MAEVKLINSDCITAMKAMADCSVDSIVTDPPYELGFMGKAWDKSGIANNPDMWREALRVLKPGGHLLAFSGSRTYHRMTCAIEDAGFEVRDQIMWIYGSGFPKSLDVSKAIDKAAGVEREITGTTGKCGMATAAENYQSNEKWSGLRRDNAATAAARQWQGWGTALKPAHEPICVARKPLIGTVAANVLAHGTGAINVDGCRVGESGASRKISAEVRGNIAGTYGDGLNGGGGERNLPFGRWPANLIHDGSEEVLAGFPNGRSSGIYKATDSGNNEDRVTNFGGKGVPATMYADTGSAARFFYCAKASKADREAGNTHPTVKPTDLMRYLCRLVTQQGGVILDPFMGSGSTGKAAVLEGFDFIGIDMTAEYIAIADARIKFASTQTEEIKAINQLELI